MCVIKGVKVKIHCWTLQIFTINSKRKLLMLVCLNTKWIKLGSLRWSDFETLWICLKTHAIRTSLIRPEFIYVLFHNNQWKQMLLQNESQSLTFPLDISQTKKVRKLQIELEAPWNSCSRVYRVLEYKNSIAIYSLEWYFKNRWRINPRLNNLLAK